MFHDLGDKERRAAFLNQIYSRSVRDVSCARTRRRVASRLTTFVSDEKRGAASLNQKPLRDATRGGFFLCTVREFYEEFMSFINVAL